MRVLPWSYDGADVSIRKQLRTVPQTAPEPAPIGTPVRSPLSSLPGAIETTEAYYAFIREHPEVSERDVRTIDEWLPLAERVLDLGCGAGEFLSSCQGRFQHAMGVDISLASARVCHATGLPALVADGGRLPFTSSSLDVVRAREVMEHVLDLLPFAHEIYRVLKPGGLFLSHTPTQYSTLYPVTNFWDDFTHVRPLSRMALVRLFGEVGFETLSIRGYTAGRNAVERVLCRVLGRVFPYVWVALARKPESAEAPGLHLVKPPSAPRLDAAA